MKNNGWKSYLCLEILEKNEQICTVKFQNFLEALPPDPILGKGAIAPPQTHPSALRRFAPQCLRSLHRPSLYVIDTLRYFRPWQWLLQCFYNFASD